MYADRTFYIIIATLFGCFDLITMIFSVIVIIIITTNWHSQYRSITNLLTCNSCAALLFYAISNSIQIPFILQNDQFYSFETVPTFCKIRAFLITSSTAVKAYSYLVHAISRFFIIFHHKRRSFSTFRFNWIIIITSWIASGIIASGMFISPLAYQYEPESHLCSLSTRNFLTSFLAIVVIFFVTTNTTIILYGIILFYTMRYNRINPNNANTLQTKRNIKVFRKILIFIAILIIGGTPYLLTVILNLVGEAPWSLYSISILFITFSAAIESIALLFTNEQVKKIFLDKLGCVQTKELTRVPRTILKLRKNQIAPHPNI